MTNIRKGINISSLFLILLSLGGLYAWSAYVPALIKEHSYEAGDLQFIFGLCIAIFAVSLLAVPPLLRFGHRFVFMLCAVFYIGGNFLIAYLGSNYVFLLIGYSIMMGISLGLGYLTSISCCMRGFVKTGIAVGITIAAYGGGSILLTYIIQFLLSLGIPVLNVFRTVGIIYGAVILICGLVIKLPKQEKASRSILTQFKKLVFSQVEFTRILVFLLLGILLSTLPGLLMVSSIKPMGIENAFSSNWAGFGIVVFSIANLASRFLTGLIFDVLNKKFVFLYIIYGLTILASLIYLLWAPILAFFLISIFLTGLAYGANFPFYPLYVAHIYGQKNVEIVYPFAFIGHGIGSLFGGTLGAFLFSKFGNYNPMILSSAIICVVGLIAVKPIRIKTKA